MAFVDDDGIEFFDRDLWVENYGQGFSNFPALQDGYTNYPHNTESGAEFYGTKRQMFLSRRGKLTVLGDRNAVVNPETRS